MMNNDEKYLREKLIILNKREEEFFINLINNNGYDKVIEFLTNYMRIVKVNEEIPLKDFMSYILYEYYLSEVLFTLLRVQEDLVKGYLSNVFNDVKINIEERPSNYMKTKYYFKIPYGGNRYLDIRTFSYEKGPVSFYDAIKTMDFGDVNVIMSHMPLNIISGFSKNPHVIEELDQTRKLRNYVYHHNILFSLGKALLVDAILLLIKNLPGDLLKESYIKEINEYKYKQDVDEKILIQIGEKERKIIF